MSTPALNETLVGIIAATDAAVKADIKNATIVFRASGSGSEGVRTDLQLRGHEVVIDEPASLGGADAGATPVEHALASLLSCQVVTYRFWAAKLGIELTDISAELEGDFDARGFFGLEEGVRAGFGEVRVALRLSGPETPERYRELQEAVDNHCPVLDLFRNPTPVTTVLTTG